MDFEDNVQRCKPNEILHIKQAVDPVPYNSGLPINLFITVDLTDIKYEWRVTAYFLGVLN